MIEEYYLSLLWEGKLDHGYDGDLAVCNMAAPVYEDASLTMCVVLLPKAMEVTVN